MSDAAAPRSEPEPIFVDVSADASAPTEIESLCMNCQRNGTTRLLLTKIPHFREVILMSFSCPHCYFGNNEIQFGGSYGEKGQTMRLRVDGSRDLNRQVVKSDWATLRVPELDFEVPPESQKGTLNTVEGFLMTAHDALKENQPVRRIVDPDGASKIDQFLERLKSFLEGGHPFTLEIDDPSGNSYVENPLAPEADPKLQVVYYDRTDAQNSQLGLTGALLNTVENQEQVHEQLVGSLQAAQQQAMVGKSGAISLTEQQAKRLGDIVDIPQEVVTFPSPCPACHRNDDQVRMVMTTIPHFKDVVIMAFTCSQCGYRTTEIKAGGEISTKARRIILHVEDVEDLNRDILKSETAALFIPEAQLELAPGTLGGLFTTVEGMVNRVLQEMKNMNSFALGDSAMTTERQRFLEFCAHLEELMQGRTKFTLILDDPLANSYIQNLYAPDPDPQLEVEEYERSHDQDEELGLNDIKTEEYGATAE